MRTFAILAIALIGTTLNCTAQKILVQTAELRSNVFDVRPIQVGPGQLVEIIDFFTTNPRIPAAAGRTAVIETQAGEEYQIAQSRLWSAGSPLSAFRTIKILGEINLRIRAEEGSHVKYYLYYRIIDNVETAATQTSQTVVIPEDAKGNVEIILESSRDLVSWTAATPGVYDSQTTDQRFFRVRAVKLE